VKRVHDEPAASDGLRVLVDRLWPRGLTKEKSAVELWLQGITPSDELRRRYHGEPALRHGFRAAYAAELATPEGLAACALLLGHLRSRPVTPLYAGKDPERNNAIALRDLRLGAAP
jgi:uncharacterized protein YeaO (DUF488 family)